MKILLVGNGEREQILFQNLTRNPSGLDVQIVSIEEADRHNPDTYTLLFDDNGLGVHRNRSVVRVDFAQGKNTHRRMYGGGRDEMLAKAVGIKKGNIIPSVLDATAGLGGDAFVLASLGCAVRMCERNPLIHALLADGLARAAGSDDATIRAIAARMRLEERDALLLLPTLTEDRPDVIYLDPMFPEGRRKSAVKKGMAALHDLVGRDEDADALLPLALEAARYRVVVKRALHAPFLNAEKPSDVFAGDTIRFDVHAFRSMAIASSGGSR